jgi:hypothetical protein
MALRLLIIGAAVFLGWVLFFQILIPWATDRPLFGMFKSRERWELEQAIIDARAEADLYELEDELDETEKKNIDKARGINQA